MEGQLRRAAAAERAESPIPSDDTPWLPIALSIAGALIVVGVGATQLHRVRLRRRPATGSAG